MENFSDFAKSAWQTDDGITTYCVPIASVIQGFIYNKKIFKELKLSVPRTNEEFIDTLAYIKNNSQYRLKATINNFVQRWIQVPPGIRIGFWVETQGIDVYIKQT